MHDVAKPLAKKKMKLIRGPLGKAIGGLILLVVILVGIKVMQIGKTVAFVEAKLLADGGTVLATATSNARLVETAKALR